MATDDKMASSTPTASTPTPTPTSSTPSATKPPTTTTVKRACDACHRRKVRCDGLKPCRNCSSAQLGCTYLAIPQKKGPKGSRAKVISELRETQRQSTLGSKLRERMSGMYVPPHVSPTLAPTPGLLTEEIVRSCIDFFFANMYPTLPILHRQRLEQQAQNLERDADTYCLMTSLCAFMLIQPGMPIPGNHMGLDSLPGANMACAQMLLDETLRVRKGYEYIDNPTQNAMTTSYFLFASYFGLELHNKAWFHLREATTLAHMIGLNKEETYAMFDMIDSSRRRRLYWLLFVTERAYALQRHRPITLEATIALPTPADDPTESSAPLSGFIHLVTLFRPFDQVFISLWNKTRSDCDANYLSRLQKTLHDAVPSYLNSSDAQTADLRVSQQWLKTMVWQLSIQNGCLSSQCEDPAMTFGYPVDIARELCASLAGFSPRTMELHGTALIEKLFDVACSLTDVLAVLPSPGDPFTEGPREYLKQIVGMLSQLRRGDNRFLQLLFVKVSEVLPTLVSPMLTTVPENPLMAAGNDIFDGFGNAGLGVPALGGYETKACPPTSSVGEIGNLTNVGCSDNGGCSNASSNGCVSQAGSDAFTPPPGITINHSTITSVPVDYSAGIAAGIDSYAAFNPMRPGIMRQGSSAYSNLSGIASQRPLPDFAAHGHPATAQMGYDLTAFTDLGGDLESLGYR